MHIPRLLTSAALVVGLACGLAASSTGVQVRSGDRILAMPNSGCTSSFALTDGRGGNYLTVAGHCVEVVGTPQSPRPDEFLWTDLATAPPVTLSDGTRIGVVVYSVDVDDTYEDFALVKLDTGVTVSPDIPGIGIPTKQSEDYGLGTLVRQYGHGQVVSALAPNREGRVLDSTDVLAMTTIPVSPGDSGGPVVDGQGAAFGIVSGITAGVTFTPSRVLTANGTRVIRLDAAMVRAREVTGLDLQLVTTA